MRVKLLFLGEAYKTHEMFQGKAIVFVRLLTQMSTEYPTKMYIQGYVCILSLSSPQETDVKLDKGWAVAHLD